LSTQTVPPPRIFKRAVDVAAEEEYRFPSLSTHKPSPNRFLLSLFLLMMTPPRRSRDRNNEIAAVVDAVVEVSVDVNDLLDVDVAGEYLR